MTRRGAESSMTDTNETNGMADAEVDPKLLEILVCPVTKGPLEFNREAQELVSRQAGLAFPVRNGIPIMLPEEARELADAERR